MLAVFAVVIALMGLSAIGWSKVARDLVAAIGRGADISGLSLLSVSLLLLFYPLVDATSWQRIAALEKDAAESVSPPEARSARLLRLLRRQGVECALVFAFTAALGCLAAATMGTSSVMSGLGDMFQRLAAGQNLVEIIAGALLLIGLLAIVLSAMSALLSASLCAIRYDVMPLLIAGPPSASPPLTDEASVRRRSVMLVGAIYLIVFLVAVAAEALQLRSTSTAALLFAVAGTQLSYVPLVLGPIIGGRWLQAGEPGVGDGDHLRGFPRYRMRRRPLPGDGRRVVAVGRGPRQPGAERPVVRFCPAALEMRGRQSAVILGGGSALSARRGRPTNGQIALYPAPKTRELGHRALTL